MVTITLTEVSIEDPNTGTEVPMSGTEMDQVGVWTDGLGPCYAVGIYGTTTAGVAQMLLCHADSTMGDGDGETVVRDCITAFGQVQGELVIVVIAGSSPSRQYYQAKTIADVSFEPPRPAGAPRDFWTVGVQLLPGGEVNWSTLVIESEAERRRIFGRS